MARVDPLDVILSPDLICRAIRLEKFGSNAYGWSIDDAALVVRLAGGANVIVLGGDFWLMEAGGTLHRTSDSWFYEPTGDRETDVAAAALAAQKALQVALEFYREGLWVELVCRS